MRSNQFLHNAGTSFNSFNLQILLFFFFSSWNVLLALTYVSPHHFVLVFQSLVWWMLINSMCKFNLLCLESGKDVYPKHQSVPSCKITMLVFFSLKPIIHMPGLNAWKLVLLILSSYAVLSSLSEDKAFSIWAFPIRLQLTHLLLLAPFALDFFWLHCGWHLELIEAVSLCLLSSVL